MTHSITLLITSGDGPKECRRAVAHVLQTLKREADKTAIDIDIAKSPTSGEPKSAVIRLHGACTRQLADQWIGTIQWTCKSQFRKNHKRQNWFIGVFEMPDAGKAMKLDPQQVRFETFRAGGPGGQHQNTTDSAVRASCQSTGLSVVVREGRSQHRNKAIAVERLQHLILAREALNESEQKKKMDHFHHELERGNPVRKFKGDAFNEVTK